MVYFTEKYNEKLILQDFNVMATGLMSLPVFLLYKVDLRIFDCSVLASELFG